LAQAIIKMELLCERLAPLDSFRECLPKPHPIFDPDTVSYHSDPKGDPKTYPDEKAAFEGRKILFEKPQLFLEKFGHLLTEDEINLFEENAGEEVKIWVEKLRRRRQLVPMKVRMRRRKQYLKQMKETDDSYFTEHEMARRNPTLFHEMLGQYGYVTRFKNDPKNPVTSLLFEHLDRTLQRDEESTNKKETDYNMGDESATISIGSTNAPDGIARQEKTTTATGNTAKVQEEEEEEDEDTEMSDEDTNISPRKKAKIQKDWDQYVSNRLGDSANKDALAGHDKDPSGLRIRNARDFVDTFGQLTLTEEELENAKKDFFALMEEQFLRGLDDIDYRDIDEESILYDDLDELQQDAEDAYFSE